MGCFLDFYIQQESTNGTSERIIEDKPSLYNLGGVFKNEVLKGKTVKQVLEEMLFTYNPNSKEIDNYFVKLLISEIDQYQESDTISSGTYTFEIQLDNKDLLVPDSLKLYDHEGNLIANNLSLDTTSYQFEIDEDIVIDTNETDSLTWYAEVTDTYNRLLRKNYTVYFIPPFYVGKSPNTSVDSDEVVDNFTKMYSYNFIFDYDYKSGSYNYYYILVPQNKYSNLKKWVDNENNLDVAYTELNDTVLINNINHKVYRTTYQQTGEINSHFEGSINE